MTPEQEHLSTEFINAANEDHKHLRELHLRQIGMLDLWNGTPAAKWAKFESPLSVFEI